MSELTNLTAIVTGSTSGIGLSIAQHLIQLGCNVVLNGRSPPSDQAALVRKLAALQGGDVIYCAADVGKPADWTHLVEKAERQFGAVDILVNNAGIQFTALVEEFPLERWEAILNTNLSSAFYGIRIVLPQMKQRNFGRIINIASVHGLVASAQKSAYVAAKHGILGLTKTVALETASYDITCNAVCPGWVDTPLVQKQIEDRAVSNQTTIETETVALVGEKQPNQRFVNSNELAKLVALLSRRDMNSLTGVALPVDGGWTAQ